MAFKLAKVLGNSHATHGVAWHLQILCSRSLPAVLYNMHHEGSSPGPGRAGEEPLSLLEILY